MVVLVLPERGENDYKDYDDSDRYWDNSGDSNVRLPTIELDLSLTSRQRTGFLIGVFLAGGISLLTIGNNQNWLRVLRLSLVSAGAIAGGVLLYEYRTPSKLEKQMLELQQREIESHSNAASSLAAVEVERTRLYQEQEQLDKQLQQWADEQMQSWKSQLEDQAAMYEMMIVQLRSRIDELEGIKRPAGTSRIAWVANQIIDVLLEYEVEADYHDSHAIPGSDIVWVIPRSGVKVKKLKELSEEIHLRLPGVESVEISLTDDGTIQIVCSTDKAKTERQKLSNSKSDRAIVDDPSWFEKMITHPDVNHLFVNGDTGSGKSTLIDNFISAAKRELGREVEIIIIDPKFPDSSWVIDGEEFLPQFKGYDRLIDESGIEHPSAIDGLYQMLEDVRSRLATAAQAKLAGRDKPNRKPRIYVIDEAEDLVATFGEDAAEPIRSVLRVGRSTKVKAIIIGQNSGCKAYKLEKANLRNAAQLYLRENALAGVDQVGTTVAIKKVLRDQVAQRQHEGESDRSKRFYCLVKYPGCPAFTALAPKPGSYSAKFEPEFFPTIEELVEEAIEVDSVSKL